MKYKIVTKEAFNVIGFELKTSTKDGNNFAEIPKFWQKIINDNLLETIPKMKNAAASLGICMDFEEGGKFSYLIASEVTDTTDVPAGMVAKEIPKAEYAVFTAVGEMPHSIQNVVKYIYGEWFPNSEYKRTCSPEFELYDERCHGKEPEVDIYVAVTKK